VVFLSSIDLVVNRRVSEPAMAGVAQDPGLSAALRGPRYTTSIALTVIDAPESFFRSTVVRDRADFRTLGREEQSGAVDVTALPCPLTRAGAAMVKAGALTRGTVKAGTS
jgi:hypothetical protein